VSTAAENYVAAARLDLSVSIPCAEAWQPLATGRAITGAWRACLGERMET